MAIIVPVIVTINGALFTVVGTTKVGGVNINFEKNQPERIVPIDNRIRAPFRLGSSSPIGKRDNVFGEVRKQNTTIRNLYTAVNIVANNLRIRPSLFNILAPAASSIRSLE